MREGELKRRIVVIIVLAIMPISFIFGFAAVLYRVALVMLASYDVGVAVVIIAVATSVYAHISKALVMTWYGATVIILKGGRVKK